MRHFDWSLLLIVLVAAAIVGAPLALVAAWQPVIGAGAITIFLAAAAFTRPG